MKLAAAALLVTTLFGCSGYSATSEPALVSAAKAQISDSAGTDDTQCSDYVASVLRRMNVGVPAFQANDFDEIMARYLPTWKMAEFDVDGDGDLKQGRTDLRRYLNSRADHTAFLAQWPRVGESGHVAIVYKVATDEFQIFQAQAGLHTPYAKSVKVESLLYGRHGVERSKIRLWSEN